MTETRATAHIRVFYGAAIDNSTERDFLRRLRRHLESNGEDAVIFANFEVGRDNRQVDFVICTERRCVVVEVKGYRPAVEGSENGEWHLVDGWIRRPVGTPYSQALNNRFAVSDLLRKVPDFAGDTRVAVSGFLCIFPETPAGSSLPASNHKLGIGGFDALATHLRSAASVRLPLETWVGIADRLRLTAEGLLATADDRKAVGEYLSNCLQLATLNIGPHVEAEIRLDEQICPLPPLLPLLEQGNHVHLVGPSGVGKTHLNARLIVEAARSGVVPIPIAARDFEKSLLLLLQQAVARSTTVPFLKLMRSAARAGSRVLICVDALNECPAGRRPDLLAALQTASLRYGVGLFMTGQQLPDLPASLQGIVFELVQPTDVRRRLITEAHIGRPLTETEASILEVVSSAQDATVLAETLAMGGKVDGRFQLYNAFTLGRLPDSQHRTELHAGLARMAHDMRGEYTTQLPAHVAARMLDRTAGVTISGKALAEEAERSSILITSGGLVRFRHDLIADYFAADHLIRHAQDAADLVRLAERPINAELREFFLGGASLSSETALLLDNKIASTMIDAALYGRCGGVARRLVQDRCRDVIDKIKVAYSLSIFTLPLDGQETPHRAEFTLPETFDLTEPELMAAHALSTAVNAGLYDEVMSMIADVDEHLWAEARRLRAENPDLKRNMPGMVFEAVYGVMFHPARGALLRSLLDNITNGRIGGGHPATDIDLNAELDTFEFLTPGQIFLLLSMHRASLDRHIALPSRMVELIPHVWKLGIYHLRLQLLDIIHFGGRSAADDQRSAIYDVLVGYLSDNAWMNTILVDAITAVGELELGLSVESIVEDLEDIAAQEPTKEIADRARSAYSSTYDHPAEDKFCEAFFERISPETKTAILIRAIADPGADSMTLEFAIRDLGRASSEQAIPFLHPFSFAPMTETVSTQSAVAVFCEAIGQLAQLEAPLQQIEDDAVSAALRAWHGTRSLLYALNMPVVPGQAQIDALWAAFRSADDGAAMDVVFRLVKESRYLGGDASVDFLGKCADGLRSLALAVIGPNYAPQSIFKHEGGRDLAKRHRQFAFHCLEHVGRSTDKALIEMWRDDSELGRASVSTLRAIETRRPK